MSSAASKREARSYLSRFHHPGPVSQPISDAAKPIHTALVLIKKLHSIDDTTLNGIGKTLAQLSQLGLICAVVIDDKIERSSNPSKRSFIEWRDGHIEQADRVVAAISQDGSQQARRLDNVIEALSIETSPSASVKIHGLARVIHRNLISAPLRRNVIPVIAPVGYNSITGSLTPVESFEVVLALTREFSGLVPRPTTEGVQVQNSQENVNPSVQISLDRMIILDPYGGIPSTNRSNGPHIFINLEQEYEDIRYDLHQSQGRMDQPSFQAHLTNLQLMKDALALLPPSSSGLLTTPHRAANLPPRTTARGISSIGDTPQQQITPPNLGVRTRAQRNPLIHNLLTDKPILSSSLPTARLSTFSEASGVKASPTTFLKRGMPVTIIPDPRRHPWTPPVSSFLKLTDPRLDLPRLIHLIEDSFGRKLNVQHYLERISSKLAGIIIAGSYEGGAILTWEAPSHGPDRLVPYLDKFAVLKRSQGAGGVADIVFSAMVQECFPEGVVWRSRRDNPVNKWYFERAKGTRQLPTNGEQGWTMFWTTEEVSSERFGDYEAVCKSIKPSWSDGKTALD